MRIHLIRKQSELDYEFANRLALKIWRRIEKKIKKTGLKLDGLEQEIRGAVFRELGIAQYFKVPPSSWDARLAKDSELNHFHFSLNYTVIFLD